MLLGGTISGTGSLTQTGTGTTTLIGNNDYAGVTTISAGTLQLGDGGTTGTLGTGNVVNGGSLVFNRGPGGLAVDNTISGAGSVTFTGGSGYLVTATNANTGIVNIVNSTVEVGTGGTTGTLGSGAIVNNGSLIYRRSDNYAVGNAISGSGLLGVVGAGVATLTGNNSYTGVTRIGAGGITGAVRVGNGGNSGTLGSGDVLFFLGGGTLTFDRSGALTVSGAISGPGSVTQAGAGTTTLTGNNSYTLATTISKGTLQVGAGGASGTLGTGNVVNNAALVFNRSGAMTVGGVISGTGSVTKLGSGTTTLTAANTYAGGTTVQAGTLALSGAGSVAPAGALNLSASGAKFDISAATGGGRIVGSVSGVAGTSIALGANTLNLGGATPQVFAGAIGGTGGIVKQGIGSFTLSGTVANSYEGGTALKEGRIDVGNNLALGKGELAMDDGTTLGFTTGGLDIANAIRMTGKNDPVIDTGAFSETLSGVISGAGFLAKDGTGKLTLTGENTYTGTTTINAGTLQIGNGGTTGTLGTGAITNLGALVFDRSDSIAVGNAIGGTGSLTQAGSGTLTLGGVNTYSGATTVSAGTLRAGAVNSFSAASAHTVATGATLDLAGFNQTVAGVTNAGTVSLRGSTPGTVLTVTGPWVGQGGTLALGTALGGNASASDRLLLSGASAVASGTTALQVTNLGGLGGQTTGNGVALVSTENGASIQGNAFSLAAPVAAGAYEYRLTSDAGGAYLSSTSTTPVPNAPPTAATPLYRTEVPLLAALPEQLRQANLAMLGSMHQRIGDSGTGSAEQGTRQAWARVLTVDRDIRQGGTVSPSSEGRLTGFQAGTDLWATPAWRAGVYVGRLEGDMKVSGFARGIAGYGVGSNDLKNDYLGGYVGYRDASGLYVDGVLQGGRHSTSLGTLAAPAGGSKGTSLLASIEVGQAFALGAGWSLEPQLQLVHQRLGLDDTALVGATVQQDAHNGWAVRAGLRIQGEFATGAGTLQPYARLNVWRTSSGTDRARFIGPAAFADIVTPTGGTSTEAALGANWQVTPAVGVYGELGQLWASGGTTKTKGGPNASLGVKVRW
ncbi:MAG: autotransporter domain-containing protein [Comamonadaceae bacterium]|nr:MAG: autotransporter domain-containing protein [Comamonadaceae bacterium]